MRVAVLSGGRSSEHQISLESGASVAVGLREAGHETIEVLIERDGRWLSGSEEIGLRAGLEQTIDMVRRFDRTTTWSAAAGR